MVAQHSFTENARLRARDASAHVDQNSEEVDLADAERVLEDLVSKSRVAAVARQISNEVGTEGGVSRIDKVDLRPEAR